MSIRKRMMQDIDRDIADHIAMETQDNIDRGMSPEEARHAALRKFGNVTRVTEDTRSAWGYVWLEQLWQDLRFGVRMFFKSPGFTAVAVITLALGIGANTAIFSMINAIMFRTLPVKNPRSLVSIKWTARHLPDTGEAGVYSWGGCPDAMPTPQPVSEGCNFSYPMFERFKGEQVLSEVFAMVPSSVPVNAFGHSGRANGLCVSGTFFSMLGVRPLLGRLLIASDDNSSASPAAVVGYRFWKTFLNGDPNIVGKPISFGKARYTLVGIASPEFGGLDPGVPSDFWVPLTFQPGMTFESAPKALWLAMMARLKPGVTASQTEAALSAMFAQNATRGPMAIFKPEDLPGIELPTAAYGLNSLRYDFTRPLLTLLTAVGLVLLIACANIAGLMLARSKARQKEIAMRTALGASRVRIVQQLLAESMLLSLAGGAAGLLLGYWGARTLMLFLSSNWSQPIDLHVQPDAHVLGFTLTASVLVGILFGLAPALNSRNVDLTHALKETTGSAAGTPNGSWFTLANGLIIGQMALTVIVLVGTGLLVRTLTNLKNTNIGFDSKNLVIFDLDATYSSRTATELRDLGPEIRQRIAGMAGVTSVTYSFLPLMKGSRMFAKISSIGPEKQSGELSFLPIAPDFFETMVVPLVVGRTITVQDIREQNTGARRHVAIVNQAFVRRYFGNQRRLGDRFRTADNNEFEIIGVVGDMRHENLRDASLPTVYVPIFNIPGFTGLGTFEVRTAIDSKSLMSAIRAEVSHFDSNLLVTNMKTQTEQIEQNIYQERLVARLSALFTLVALILACVGVHGRLSYQVSMRTQEIGVRLALGAQRGNIARIVLRQAFALTSIGATIGVIAALGLTRFLQSFLYGVKTTDSWTIATACLLLLGWALLASYIPARRAMRIDPMEALRYE